MPHPFPDPTRRLAYQASAPIFQAFVQQAQCWPEATAITTPDFACSYRQLERISHGIAAHLLALGVAAGARVVIVSSRCAGLVYGLLGASRAGLTFSVADAAYPPGRIEQIIDLLRPACVLVCGSAEVAVNLKGAHVIKVPEAPDVALRQFGNAAVDLPEVDPARPAYITFTSGSTGEPKGIVTHHAPLVHFVRWHVEHHRFTRDECFSMVSGLGHDPVYRDVFTPLSIGARIACPAQATLTDPQALATWVHGEGVTVMHLTPPLGRLIETGATLAGLTLERLRYLFWGGDALSPALHQQIRAVAPQAASVNFYGTTETPQAMAFHPIEASLATGRIPLGKGIDDAQLLVLNEAGQLAGEGETGEILIRSPYLSLGYWGDTALTGEKFVVNPFTGDARDICYRTGDQGTYLPDGSVDFLGRADSQVKIRGHRIELAEIESTVARDPRIRQCVVLALNEHGATKLVACCVARQAVASAELRDALGALLPDYMVPAQWLFLDSVPLTPNGKVDKRALAKLVDTTGASSAGQPLTPVAQQLCKAWARILQVPSIDSNLTFVELGGDSLTFVQASMTLQKLIGQLPERWETTPVRVLAALSVASGTRRRAMQAIEVPVLLRMLAIILIVAGHFGLFGGWVVTGDTATLFLISGLSLARFQLQAIEERGDARALLRSVAAIALPTVLYTVLIQCVFDRLHWQSLLLVSNWFAPEQVGVFNYWYIEVLVQMILLIGLVLSIGRVRRAILANPFRSLALAACALLVADVLITLFVYDASLLYNRVPQHYLAITVLGMAVHYADSTARKWVASALAVLVIGELDLFTLAGYGWEAAMVRMPIDIALPAVLALIWVRAVPVPALLARVGTLIASSTLFIYLTHYQFKSVAQRLLDQPVFALVLCLVGGVVVGYCWNGGVRWVMTRWSRGRGKRPVDTVESAV
ncbi:amino acid adenylation domain-containing protein [Pseudomonas entomophila]|uniref:amino acid adenylation domain-containing protein n=1 Tax=Pseudomonas entomophila TaxID=312306 RepID=UPI0024073BE3|nr:amino acid adenylation domain-containing protein [Pseudomonas entomophila]MDF9619502.1 amino acid adenylation domain-containing protein [Pseudomonas entomophila]